ncbi:MAG: hypothetical protein MUO59_06845 [Actinobacteria bacterium]|nr:hypothetical protein [Actinomycetota bacterium]
MKRNKLYVILSILTIIFLFSFASLCNQCSAPAGDKIDVGDENGSFSGVEGIESPDSEAESTEDSGNQSGEDVAEEEGAGDEDAEKEAPTIKIEIYEGPVYFAGDDVCFYRIKAIVTGFPDPKIEWSKDDSNGSWGAKKSQVNINDPGDSYTLTATATNSEGSASDSTTLSWGCNKPPVIASIVVDENFHYTDETYRVVVNTSDPDGDTLTVNWSVNGGSVNNVHANPMNWTTPAIDGDYEIIVEVDDGNGGVASLTKAVEVLPALPPDIEPMDIP